ncbi:uncharacterized protein Osi9 [Anabrus simplex]|uniref:uncharacterized protein Osi9 n=1 Tax=Anabrus simplex TaxID=316456 RepID=UPI0034DD653E
MMVFSKWMVVFVLGLACCTSGFPAEDPSPEDVPQKDDIPSPISSIENGLEQARQFIQTCGNKDLVPCLKVRALTAVDRALRRNSISIMDGVSLVKSDEAAEESSRVLNGRAVTEAELDATLPGDAEEKDAQVENLLVDRIARFFESFTVQLKMPDSAISEVRKTLDEARGKKKKIKMLLPLLLLLKLKATALIPVALGALALLSLKALIVGKLALLLAGLIAVQKLLANRQNTQTYEVVAHPHISHSHVSSYADEHGHGHYGRSLPDAQQLAYSAYADKE